MLTQRIRTIIECAEMVAVRRENESLYKTTVSSGWEATKLSRLAYWYKPSERRGVKILEAK